ncbi:ABC transporter ATP-binding protein [Aeromicrobium alkaliterrae]|uniref:ABC transporter ATP-binding protein n=1 Tax=Aeromicrobium alkaliterrae TaxID=302168 RepID=A0ABN2K902_9ACTN
MTDQDPVLDLSGLTIDFGARRVLHGLDLRIGRGECVALVGESGSGKSVTAKALLGLLDARVATDRFTILGQDAAALDERAWRRIRGRQVALVHQDALVSLDPLRTVAREVGEPLREHSVVPRAERAAEVRRLLGSVGFPGGSRRASQHPDELSGGLRQRALIASAVAARPALLIADEPTTALDVTVQAQVIDLLRALTSAGMAMLFISHDIAVVSQVADRIVVLRDGQVVETGPVEQILHRPGADFTRRLVQNALEPTFTDIGDRPAPGREVLRLEAVSKRFGTAHHPIVAATDVDLRVHQGEVVSLIGESGSGKTTVGRIALGLLSPDRGSVALDGEPWNPLPERARRSRRHRVQQVPQDPLSSFNPRYTTRRVVAEALRAQGRPAGTQEVAAVLDLVSLDADLLDRMPRSMSGGQRQRLAFARALATEPDVLVADEPFSALDATLQAELVGVLDRIRQEHQLGVLLITHDLGLAARISDRILVMRDGVVVDQGTPKVLIESSDHPYTRQLLAAVPRIRTSPRVLR